MKKTNAIKTTRENTGSLIGCIEQGYSFNTYDELINMWRNGQTQDFYAAKQARSQHMVNTANELITGESDFTEYQGGNWTDYVG